MVTIFSIDIPQINTATQEKHSLKETRYCKGGQGGEAREPDNENKMEETEETRQKDK